MLNDSYSNLAKLLSNPIAVGKKKTGKLIQPEIQNKTRLD